MLVKFKGFKESPMRDHIVIDIKGKYLAVSVGEKIETDGETGHKLLATGEWEDVTEEKKAKAPATKTNDLPAGENRAILDPKAS